MLFRWRFSLRALFIMITIAAVSLGWKLHLLREQQRVITELYAARGEHQVAVIYHAASWPQWITQLFDEHFLDAVETLQVNELTDKEAVELSHLRELRVLDIESEQLTDRGVRALQQLPHLTQLALATRHATEATIRETAQKLAQTSIYWLDAHPSGDRWLVLRGGLTVNTGVPCPIIRAKIMRGSYAVSGN